MTGKYQALPTSPRVGDPVIAALWFNSEHEADKRSATEGIQKAVRMMCRTYGLLVGPLTFEVVGPEDSRVPEPPEAYYGSPKCLVGMAVVYDTVRSPKIEAASFVSTLDRKDLLELRRVTRDLELKRSGTMLTDAECDDIINEIGPDAAARGLS